MIYRPASPTALAQAYAAMQRFEAHDAALSAHAEQVRQWQVRYDAYLADGGEEGSEDAPMRPIKPLAPIGWTDWNWARVIGERIAA